MVDSVLYDKVLRLYKDAKDLIKLDQKSLVTYVSDEGVVLMPFTDKKIGFYVKLKKDNTYSVKIWTGVDIKPKNIQRASYNYPLLLDWDTLKMADPKSEFNVYSNPETGERRYVTTSLGLLFVIKTFGSSGLSVKWSNQAEKQAAQEWNTKLIAE